MAGDDDCGGGDGVFSSSAANRLSTLNRRFLDDEHVLGCGGGPGATKFVSGDGKRYGFIGSSNDRGLKKGPSGGRLMNAHRRAGDPGRLSSLSSSSFTDRPMCFLTLRWALNDGDGV
uniref:Uncharacterized protein n=1 Tax=Romanomermis culicivorax TaxID=13658 RepID=A0A915HJY8_ROMCU